MQEQDIYMNKKKLAAYIVGASAHIARLEKILNLPELTKEDYIKYGTVHSGGSFTEATTDVGEEIFSGTGFFDWINDKIIKPIGNFISPVTSVIKPVLDNVIRPVLPVAQNIIGAVGGPKGMAINGAISGVDNVLKSVGLGNNVGGAYTIEKGGAYRIQGGSTVDPLRNTQLYLSNGQVYAPTANPVVEESKLIIGAKYRFPSGDIFMYTDKGFVKPLDLSNKQQNRVTRGGAYMDNNDNIIISSKGMTPQDFTQ